MDTIKKATKIANEKAISADTSITSRKKGFEYLNELFIKRHRKILWQFPAIALESVHIPVYKSLRPKLEKDRLEFQAVLLSVLLSVLGGFPNGVSAGGDK